MSIQDMAETFVSLYSRLYLYFYRRKNPRGYRLRPEALAVMEHLSSTGPLTISEAALHLDRSQSAASELVERLVKRGLLERIQDERDRRRTLVWLSADGRRLLAEERHVLNVSQVARALEIMTDNKRKHLIEGMATLVEAASQAAGPTDASPSRRRK